MDKIKIMLKLC